MIFLAGKAEQPVPRRVGGDVRLIHPADGERAGDALVAALHGVGVLLVKRAALLVHHDAVLFQGVEAAAVKFLGEQPLGGAEGVGGIHNDEVVLLLAAADEFEGVLKVDVYPPVVHAAGVAGQEGAAGLHHLRVHLHKVDAPHPVVAGQLPHHAAVPRADDQNVLDAGVYRHGHVGHHFVVDELIPFGEDDVAVHGQKASIFE